MPMMLIQSVMDPTIPGLPAVTILTPVKTTLLGLSPTGDPPIFQVFNDDPTIQVRYPVCLPVTTAEEALEMLKDRAQMEALCLATRADVMKQMQAEKVRLSLRNTGGLLPGNPPQA